MRLPTVLILSATALALGGAPADIDDFKTIQGTWTLFSTEEDGAVAPSSSLKSGAVTMIFQGDRILVRKDNETVSIGSFSLDPLQTPKAYNRIYSDGTPRKGIYKLDGDSLTVCIAAIRKERPKVFATTNGDGCTQLVYKRAKP